MFMRTQRYEVPAVLGERVRWSFHQKDLPYLTILHT